MATAWLGRMDKFTVMTDVLIRDVPDVDLSRIDEHAARQGLSRGEYLRRQIASDVARSPGSVTADDLKRFADRANDLLDEDVMREAWP